MITVFQIRNKMTNVWLLCCDDILGNYEDHVSEPINSQIYCNLEGRKYNKINGPWWHYAEK